MGAGNAIAAQHWKPALGVVALSLLLNLLFPNPTSAALGERKTPSLISAFDAKDRSLCTGGRTAAGIPYCSFFGFFSADAALDEKRQEIMILRKEAPGDATLLYLSLTATNRQTDTTQIDDDAKTLLAIAEAKGDRPLASVVRLVQMSKRPLTEQSAKEFMGRTSDEIALADKAAEDLPDESQKLYFRAKVRLTANQLLRRLLPVVDRQSFPMIFAQTEKYEADTYVSLKARSDADPDNPDKLEAYKEFAQLNYLRQKTYGNGNPDEIVAINERLVKLKQQDDKARSNLLSSYHAHALYALEQNDRKAVDADIEKIEKTMAETDFSAMPGLKFYTLSTVSLRARSLLGDAPDKAADMALTALQNGNEQQVLPFLYPLTETLARSAARLFKDGRKAEANAIRDKAIASLDKVQSPTLSTRPAIIFFNAYEAALEELDVPVEAAELNRVKLQWLQNSPIGSSLTPYFNALEATAKSATVAAEHKAIANAALAYVSDERLEAAQINDSADYSGSPLRQATLGAAEKLNDIGNILYDAKRYGDSARLFKREIALRSRFTPEEVTSSITSMAAKAQYDLYYALRDEDDFKGALLAAEEYERLRRLMLDRRPFGSDELVTYGKALRLLTQALEDVPGNRSKRDEALTKYVAVANLLARKHGGEEEAAKLAKSAYQKYNNEKHDDRAHEKIPALDLPVFTLKPFFLRPVAGLDGVETPSLDTLKGHVSVLNFWGAWCPACRNEHHLLLQLREKGIRLVGVNYLDSAERAVKYLKDSSNPYLLVGAQQDKGSLMKMLDVDTFPQTFVIGPDAEILWHRNGALNERALEELVKAVETAKAGGK